MGYMKRELMWREGWGGEEWVGGGIEGTLDGLSVVGWFDRDEFF